MHEQMSEENQPVRSKLKVNGHKKKGKKILKHKKWYKRKLFRCFTDNLINGFSPVSNSR